MSFRNRITAFVQGLPLTLLAAIPLPAPAIARLVGHMADACEEAISKLSIGMPEGEV
jgi:hypothetical protein